MFITPLFVPANGVAQITPQLDDVRLQTVRIVIPDGHAGLTALQIQQGGVPIFPFGSDPFIRGNNEVIDFEWDAEITANGLVVQGFNSDIFAHEWIIRWILTDLATASPVTIASPQAAAVVPLDVAGTIANLAGVA